MNENFDFNAIKSLKYRDLQKFCKNNDIKAKGKAEELLQKIKEKFGSSEYGSIDAVGLKDTVQQNPDSSEDNTKGPVITEEPNDPGPVTTETTQEISNHPSEQYDEEQCNINAKSNNSRTTDLQSSAKSTSESLESGKTIVKNNQLLDMLTMRSGDCEAKISSLEDTDRKDTKSSSNMPSNLGAEKPPRFDKKKSRFDAIHEDLINIGPNLAEYQSRKNKRIETLFSPTNRNGTPIRKKINKTLDTNKNPQAPTLSKKVQNIPTISNSNARVSTPIPKTRPLIKTTVEKKTSRVSTPRPQCLRSKIVASVTNKASSSKLKKLAFEETNLNSNTRSSHHETTPRPAKMLKKASKLENSKKSLLSPSLKRPMNSTPNKLPKCPKSYKPYTGPLPAYTGDSLFSPKKKTVKLPINKKDAVNRYSSTAEGKENDPYSRETKRSRTPVKSVNKLPPSHEGRRRDYLQTSKVKSGIARNRAREI